MQGVLAAYPHTSNWDFVVAVMAKWAIGIPVVFWGKDSLFRLPLLGHWFRWLGGVPVDRHASHGVVGDMVQRMAQARADGRLLWLALAPEGTRSLRKGLRSGFYQVAVRAGVPVGLVHLDYGRRRVGVTAFVQPGGDPVADLRFMAAQLAAVRGLRPDLASPFTLEST